MDPTTPDDASTATSAASHGVLSASVLAAPQPAQPFPLSAPKVKKHHVCRYFGTTSGCRAGNACPYIHDVTKAQGQSQPTELTSSHRKQRTSRPPILDNAGLKSQNQLSSGTALTGSARSGRQYQTVPVGQDRIVQRPVPRSEVEDPREFQLGQIRRRFGPSEQSDGDGLSLIFKMTPSDPDFPFEIEALECKLVVPVSYPGQDAPRLRVLNVEMGRGYQINVEKGFDDLANSNPTATLLGLMNRLDKQLEQLLSIQKADTVKLVSNSRSAVTPTQSQPSSTVSGSLRNPNEKAATINIPPAFTAEQKQQAQRKREADVRQLEARLGRLPLFAKSIDGYSFDVPVEPRKRSELPVALQAIKQVKLFVPLLYNLQPCRIELEGVNGEATTNVEKAFEEKAAEAPELTLISHINNLSQNMHAMAYIPSKESFQSIANLQLEEQPKRSKDEPQSLAGGDDRSHIKIIPRPPEWVTAGEESEDSSDSYISDSDYDSEFADAHSSEDKTEPQSTAVAERGIMLSFPLLELHGIELLELVSISITIKCERCKDTMDIANLRNNADGSAAGMRSESCKKCANHLAAGYRMDLMHANSARAGYLDLEGCTVVDMLPSYFIPTCSECSTPHPSPGVVSVRGESTMAICRECHKRMSFRIPEIKFLLVSAASVRASRAPPRKKPKENLGIVAGQELPRKGRCTHYGKSYRWFRFSCCSKVFPCDRCHDEASDHPNEHANRMICGFCSREQNYRPEDCGICHTILIGKKGTGFWEGGKGTRDKTRMSRKDPRKYKRRAGNKPKT